MTCMEIQRIFRVEAPDLPDWIEQQVEAAKRRGMTIPGIAVSADISPGYLYRLMKGDQRAISIEVLEALEGVFGVKYEGDRP